MILVVEDDTDTAELLVTLLERSGYPAFAVTRGQDALDVMGMVRPSGMVLDFLLPDMTGLDVLKAIKHNDDLKYVPVVFYSAAEDTTIRADAEAAGAAHWIRKGTGVGNLLVALADHC